jgi:hypothetical protein
MSGHVEYTWTRTTPGYRDGAWALGGSAAHYASDISPYSHILMPPSLKALPRPLTGRLFHVKHSGPRL